MWWAVFWAGVVYAVVARCMRHVWRAVKRLLDETKGRYSVG